MNTFSIHYCNSEKVVTIDTSNGLYKTYYIVSEVGGTVTAKYGGCLSAVTVPSPLTYTIDSENSQILITVPTYYGGDDITYDFTAYWCDGTHTDAHITQYSSTPFKVRVEYWNEDNTLHSIARIPCDGDTTLKQVRWEEFEDILPLPTFNAHGTITIGECVEVIKKFWWPYDDCHPNSRLRHRFDVVIKEGTESIEDNAFRYSNNPNRWYTSISLPNSLTNIGSGGLSYLPSLSGSITIPSGVTTINDRTFYHSCSGLTSINIPSGVTSIGNGAFEGCSGLTSINIPSGVTSIGSDAFEGCSSLTSIDIPNSVTSIGNEAFWICNSLTSCTIGSGVTSIGSGAFGYCENLTNIDIPSGVTSIRSSTFRSCTSLTSITIPSGVTTIGESAFAICSGLTSITIPSSVTAIASYAFQHCTNLTSITSLSTTPPRLLTTSIFDDTNNCPIYVPSASVNTYKAWSGWSDYADRIQPIPIP